MTRWLIITGAILIVLGILLQFAPWTVNWFGKLPGDIRIETDNGRIFIPITSMVLVSIVITILLNLFKH